MTNATDIGRMVARGPLRRMERMETERLFMIATLAQEPVEKQIEVYKEMLEKSMVLQILDSRFRQHIGEEVSFSPPLLMWFSSLANGNPGHAVLMLAVVRYMRSDMRELTLETAVSYYFGEGIPSAANLQLAWDAQKVHGCNLLDNDESWR